MNLQISGHHIDVTDSLRNYVQEKMEKVGRHFDQVIDAQVVLSVEKLVQKAEVTLHLPGSTAHAEAEGEDMYASIDKMSDRIDRQVLKLKEKMKDHHAKEALQSRDQDA